MTSTWLPPEEYVETLPKSTVYAGLYFTDTAGRPLQLKSAYKTDTWQFPGGGVEHGESPWEAAVRECREETGMAFAGNPRLLLTDYQPPDDTWPYSRIGFIFDGGTLIREQLDGIALDPVEHTAWDVRTLGQWERTLRRRTYARLAAVAAAREGGTAGYLAHGA